MRDPLTPLRGRIRDYYTAKVERHGPTPAGVDWSCGPTQQLRFVQLLRLCDGPEPWSLDDLGCGYGALLGFIGQRAPRTKFDYLGIDLSDSMVREAKRLWQRKRNASFCVGARSPRLADYAVASGVFNVRIDEPLALWESLIEDTLSAMAVGTRRGFAVNFLALLPPEMQGKPELYRTAPDRWVSFCEESLGCRTEVLDRYGMREFTLLARH